MDDDDVCFVLDQHTELDFYGASWLKQQSTGRYITRLWYIIMIQSHSVSYSLMMCAVKQHIPLL